MSAFPSKDPDAILDYVYRIPLDASDSVLTETLTELTGTVVIESESLAAAPDTTTDGYGQDVTIRLSGGTNGETAVFSIAWTTAGGRSDDDVITLAIESHEYTPVLLTGHAKPAPGDLKARYPAFSAVDGGTVQYWLTDAERSVDTSWSEADYAAALMALAAHNMTLAGIGTDAQSATGIPAGVTRMQSGSLSVSLTEAAANARLTGDLTTTRYGGEYQALLNRNKSGPVVEDTGVPVFPAFPGFPFGMWPWAF